MPPNKTNPFYQNLVHWISSDDANVVCAALKAAKALWPVLSRSGDIARSVLDRVRALVRKGSADLWERALGAGESGTAAGEDGAAAGERSLFAAFKARPEMAKSLGFVDGVEVIWERFAIFYFLLWFFAFYGFLALLRLNLAILDYYIYIFRFLINFRRFLKFSDFGVISSFIDDFSVSFLSQKPKKELEAPISCP